MKTLLMGSSCTRATELRQVTNKWSLEQHPDSGSPSFSIPPAPPNLRIASSSSQMCLPACLPAACLQMPAGTSSRLAVASSSMCAGATWGPCCSAARTPHVSDSLSLKGSGAEQTHQSIAGVEAFLGCEEVCGDRKQLMSEALVGYPPARDAMDHDQTCYFPNHSSLPNPDGSYLAQFPGSLCLPEPRSSSPRSSTLSTPI